MEQKKVMASDRALRLLFWLFSALCLIVAFIMPDRANMLTGLKNLCLLPYRTTNSYFDAANGGFAGTFLNVALVGFVCSALFSLPRSKPDGVSVLAFFLTTGFALWGTTILNIWPCFLAVALVSALRKTDICTQGNMLLFSTALTPLVTDLLLCYPNGEVQGFTLFGVLMAFAACLLIAVILPAGLAHSPKMHKGYDHYSAAVPMGLIAFFLRAILYKVFGAALPEKVGVGAGEGFPIVANAFCIAVFVLSVVLGLLLDGSFKQYGALLKDSGFGTDFSQKYGAGTAIMNFGIYGLFIVLYYNLVGANWNAATVGCVLCMASCSVKGSHPGNVWPIMVGYVAAAFATQGICTLLGTEFSLAINAQAIVIGLCFANGLSPVAGKYGWGAGILFAVLHYTIVTCVPLMHGGFLLYNGGFTAAVVCFVFIPVMEMFFKTKDEKLAAKQ